MKIKSLIMTFVIAFIVSFLFSANTFAQHNFTINGQLGADKHGKIYLQYKYNGSVYVDSGIVTNGKFVLHGEVEDPAYSSIMLNPPRNAEDAKKNGLDQHDIFLEPGIITIKSDSTLKASKITGGPGQTELNNYAIKLQPILDRYIIVNKKLHDLHDNTESTEYKQYLTEYKNINLNVRAMDSTYAANHLDSYFGFFLWAKYFRKPDDNTLAELNRFSKRIRELKEALLIEDKIAIAKRLASGKPAPDFTLADSSGKMVKLSSFRGKNVMVLFWFSDPGEWFSQLTFNMGRINRRLHDKNFVMLTVYYNTSYEQPGTNHWKEIIKNEFLNAVNLEDADGINGKTLSLVAQSYGILPKGILPLGLLIGPDGNIIESRMNLFDSQLALSLEKKLK